MFLAFMAVVIFASAPLLGGRLSRLSRLRFECAWLLFVALALQVVITEVIYDGPTALLVVLHMTTYVLAGYVIWRNRRLPGLLLLGAGALTNSIVIALNGGTLPASASALREAGYAPDPSDFENSGVLAHPVLPWLGDVVATPSWLPFRNVISLGDVVILIGAAVFVHAGTRSMAWRATQRGHAAHRSAVGI